MTAVERYITKHHVHVCPRLRFSGFGLVKWQNCGSAVTHLFDHNSYQGQCKQRVYSNLPFWFSYLTVAEKNSGQDLD